MARFSPSDAALAGLSLVGRRPGAFAVWALARMLSLGVTLLLLVGMLGPDTPGIMAALQNPQSPSAPALIAGDMETFNVFKGFAQIIGYLLVIVTESAIFRAMLSPGGDRFADLRLGGGEFRVGVVKFAYGVAAGVTAVAILIPILLVSLAGAPVVGPRIIGWAFLALGLAAVVLAATVGVRLSLAEVMSFDSGRLQFFDSWRLTRGAYGSLLGAYLLAWFLSLVIWLAVVVAVALALLGLLAAAPQFRPTRLDWEGIQPMLVPLAAAWVMIGGVAAAVSQVIMTAPAAYIYDRLIVLPGASRPSPAGPRDDGVDPASAVIAV